MRIKVAIKRNQKGSTVIAFSYMTKNSNFEHFYVSRVVESKADEFYVLKQIIAPLWSFKEDTSVSTNDNKLAKFFSRINDGNYNIQMPDNMTLIGTVMDDEDFNKLNYVLSEVKE